MSERLRALLAEGTPTPWERVTEGNLDQRHAAGMAFLNVMATKAPDNPAIEFSDLTFVRDGQGRNVCMVGNGPKQTDNGDLIAEAINALPALLDRIEALERGVVEWSAADDQLSNADDVNDEIEAENRVNLAEIGLYALAIDATEATR